MAGRKCSCTFCGNELRRFLADRTEDGDPGTVYAIALPFRMDAVKIGRTKMTLQERLYVLNTSTPEDFYIFWHLRVRDHALVERALHLILADRRISPNREFFKLARADVIHLESILRETVAIGGDEPRPVGVETRRRLLEFGAAEDARLRTMDRIREMER